MTQFFKKFPVISYNNTSAINILARVNMSKLSLTQKQAYYDYIVPEGERPDNLSYNYYDNPDYVWLLNLTNGIIDPYYDFPLSFDNLNTLILQKYGSFSNAQNKILFFRTNWASDDSIISPAAYYALAYGQKKYWAPQIDNNNTIVSYVRKQEDWTINTNEVQQLSLIYSVEILTEDGFILETQDNYDLVAPEGGNSISFIAGELVAQNGVPIATIASVDPNFIVIQHISTTAIIGPITGLTSGATGTITNVTTIAKNIPDNEAIYWLPITAYDYEHEQNSLKKNIKLLDNKFAGQATKELKSLLLT